MNPRNIVVGILVVTTAALIPTVYYQYTSLKEKMRIEHSNIRIKSYMEGWHKGYAEAEESPTLKHKHYTEFKEMYSIN